MSTTNTRAPKVVVTTVFALDAIRKELILLAPHKTYDLAAYKRVIWEGHKAGNVHITGMGARIMLLLDKHGETCFEERVSLTFGGRSDYVFLKAFLQYVTYLRELLNAPVAPVVELVAPVAAKRQRKGKAA